MLGPDHLKVAQSLNNLGLFYHNRSRYAAAEPLFQRSLAILEKVLGPEHPDVATTLDNLAELYRNCGDFEKAESLRKRAQAILESRSVNQYLVISVARPAGWI